MSLKSLISTQSLKLRRLNVANAFYISPNGVNATMLVIAGGGGSGGWITSVGNGGGGGAGGLVYNTNVFIYNSFNYAITVGAGGAGGTSGGTGTIGSNSSILGGGSLGSVSYTALGGGAGGGASAGAGLNGGSGGGGGPAGGLGLTTQSSTLGYGYGFSGGTGNVASGSYSSGGGGGAGAVGLNGSTSVGGNGGTGLSYNFANGSSVYYAGGGGGAGGSGGTGGSGGGGNGSSGTPGYGSAGTSGTGGGAGGSGSTGGSSGNTGGSGTVIVSYPLPQYFTGGVVTNNNGSNVVHTFNTSGTLTGLTTPIDTYQPYNTLLLHADNANGYNNGGFVDSVIGANTNIPFNGTYSYYFNGGTTDYLTSSASGSFYQLTGDFTIECWFKLSSLSSGGLITLTQTAAGNSSSGLSLNINSSGAVSFFVNGNQGGTNSANGLVTTNTWYHIALVRVGSTNTVYLNGVSVASNSTTPTWGTAFVGLARVYVDNTGGLLGYISNVRIIKGQGLYTGAFTPGSNTLTSTSVGTSGANVASSITGTVMALTGVAPNYADYSANAINFVLSGTVGITNGSNTAIARTGATTQGTFSPFSTTGWSNYFNGSSYLTAPSIPLGSSNWTFETWINPLNTSGVTNAIVSWDINVSGFAALRLYHTNGILGILMSINGTTHDINVASGIGTLISNTWQHLAVTKNGTTVTIYLNGVQQGAQLTLSSATLMTGTSYYVGYEPAGTAQYMNGYLSNFRILTGTIQYTSNFTPPINQFTVVSNTSILVCANNNFSASNTTASTVAMTITGTPQIQPFSPFNPTSAYSNTVVGGSMYFNGSTDYLTVSNSTLQEFGSNNFTVEFYWYPQSSSRQWFYHATTDYWFGIDFASQGAVMGLWASSTGSSWNLINADAAGNGISTGAPKNYQWNHVAVGRNGGTWSMWLNGVRCLNLTGITSAIVDRSTQNKIVGAWAGGTQYKVNGYLSNFKVVNGVDTYGVSNTTITIPAAPLSQTANTILLLNATNAGIIDSSQKNQLTTYGSAAISTKQSMFGGTSIVLGTGNYVSIPYQPTLNLLSGSNFTIECWIYPTSSSGFQTIIAQWNQGTNLGGWIMVNNSGALAFYWAPFNTTTYINNGGTLNLNQWNHVAITRNNGLFINWINGVNVVQGSSAATGTPLTTVPLSMGNYYNSGGTLGATAATDFQGYVDELRITNGYARYNANFTPPTTAFLNT